MAWQLFTDAACTQVFPGTLTFVHKTDLSDNPQDKVLYYAEVAEDVGDNQTLEKVEATNPGANYIDIVITDVSVGSGHEASEITLAKTGAALDTNTAGAFLPLGQDDAGIGVIRLLSGISKMQEIHIRVVNTVTTPGTSTELKVEAVENVERAKTTA